MLLKEMSLVCKLLSFGKVRVLIVEQLLIKPRLVLKDLVKSRQNTVGKILAKMKSSEKSLWATLQNVTDGMDTILLNTDLML